MKLKEAIAAEIEKSNKGKPKNKYQTQSQIDGNNSLETMIIKKKLDSLLYCKKNPKKELEFIEQMFTRGTGDEIRKGLHASAIIVPDSSFCLREQVLSLLFLPNEEKMLDVDLLKIFEEGNAVHEKWQRLFLRGELCEPLDLDRTRYSAHFRLSFTPDAIVTINDIKYVVEIKSMNTMSFGKAITHPSGVKQLQLYMHETGIHRGFVLAEDKNTQRTKIFLEHYEPEKVALSLGRLFDINAMVDEKTIPHKVCTKLECKRAKNCRMNNACFNIGIGRIKF